MFINNVEKCLKLFDKVYVSSDSLKILKDAEKAGAKGIFRSKALCGDTPNIPVYQHALDNMEPCDGIVAVQANSPTIDPNIIAIVKRIMEMGVDEVMTCHPDYSIYGSIWAISERKLRRYGDPYNPKPQVLVKDISMDIHTFDDYLDAISWQ